MAPRYFRLRGIIPVPLAFAVAIVTHTGALAQIPPKPPQIPIPVNGASGVSVNTTLYWAPGDDDTDIQDYDLYLGPSPSPPLLAGAVQPPYLPAVPLQELTTYYWRIVVRDTEGLTTSGPVWTFTTRAANTAPNPSLLLGPPDGGVGIDANVLLEWACIDIDADPLVFDVYLGVAPTPALVASDVSSTSYSTVLAYSTTYSWYIVARDTDGAESQSAVQTFTTRPENYPPYAAWNPSPANNSTNQPVAPTLDWEAVDPDGDLLTFDVYLGTTDPPPLVANDVVESSYAAPALVFSTQYYWRVVTRDSHDAEAPGPLWRFTTRPENYAPTAPASPSPVHLATNVSLGPSLTWQCSDADGDAMTYDLYLGTTSPPPLYATNLPSNLAQPQWLIAQTLYYWRVVARDSKGALTSGPEWRFTTRFNSTPNAPASPLPAHNAAHQLLQLTLSWGCTDPDPGQALTYDVYFGMETSPPQVAGNLTNTSWITPALETGRFYHWKIVARDPFGATRSGPVWKFSTGDNLAPLFPSNPYPPDNGELDYATGVFLAWSSYDPEFQPVTFKVYVGTSINPPLAGEVTENEYFVGSFQPGAQYYWYVIASDGELTTTGPMWTFHIDPTATGAGDPTYELSLGQNHPNPFNPQTVIPYTVPTGPPLDVRLTIYDAAGHLIRVLVNETRNAGSYHVTWRGDNDQGVTVSSGVYYGVLRAGEKRLTRKLVLLK